MTNDKTIERCIFCGREIAPLKSNNPDFMYADTEDNPESAALTRALLAGHCCPECNERIVIPARGYLYGTIPPADNTETDPDEETPDPLPVTDPDDLPANIVDADVIGWKQAIEKHIEAYSKTLTLLHEKDKEHLKDNMLKLLTFSAIESLIEEYDGEIADCCSYFCKEFGVDPAAYKMYIESRAGRTPGQETKTAGQAPGQRGADPGQGETCRDGDILAAFASLKEAVEETKEREEKLLQEIQGLKKHVNKLDNVLDRVLDDKLLELADMDPADDPHPGESIPWIEKLNK